MNCGGPSPSWRSIAGTAKVPTAKGSPQLPVKKDGLGNDMARKRQIDPSIWTSEQFCSLKDYGARLLFIGLFSNADDEGRLKASPVYLKTIIFPADEIPVENIGKWRNELSTVNLIIVYKVGELEYLVLPTFSTHQYISKAYPSKIPAPFLDQSLSTAGTTIINTIKENYVKEKNLLKNNGLDNEQFGNGAGMWKSQIVCMSGEIVDMPVLWERVSKVMKGMVSAANYSTWINPITILGVNGNVVYMAVRSMFQLERTEQFAAIFEKAMYDVTGKRYTPKFKVDSDPECVARFDEAVDTLCVEYDITREGLLGEKRDKFLVNARRELCSRTVSYTHLTLPTTPYV